MYVNIVFSAEAKDLTPSEWSATSQTLNEGSGVYAMVFELTVLVKQKPRLTDIININHYEIPP